MIVDDARSFKSLIFDGRNGARLIDRRLSELATNHVRIRTLYSLVSRGTELHYLNECRKSGKTLFPGYCVVGQVEEINGFNTEVSVGDICVAMGWQMATHSEYVDIPFRLAANANAISQIDCAVFAAMLPTALHARSRAKTIAQDKILVAGTGLVGKLLAELLVSEGMDVSVVDVDREKLADFDGVCEAKIMEPDQEDQFRDFTKIFLCMSGSQPNLLTTYLKMLSPSGNGHHRSKLIVVGRIEAPVCLSADTGNVDIVVSSRAGLGYRDDSYIYGSQQLVSLDGECTVDQNLRHACTLLARNSITLRTINRRIFQISDWRRAFEDLSSSKLDTILFTYGGQNLDGTL